MEYMQQMPNELQSLEAHIKDKTGEMKVEYRRHKSYMRSRPTT